LAALNATLLPAAAWLAAATDAAAAYAA